MSLVDSFGSRNVSDLFVVVNIFLLIRVPLLLTCAVYSPAREISAAAKRTVASTRVIELSAANVRDAMAKVQFNAQAFVVSEAALKAHATPRIAELAQPIMR